EAKDPVETSTIFPTPTENVDAHACRNLPLISLAGDLTVFLRFFFYEINDDPRSVFPPGYPQTCAVIEIAIRYLYFQRYQTVTILSSLSIQEPLGAPSVNINFGGPIAIGVVTFRRASTMYVIYLARADCSVRSERSSRNLETPGRIHRKALKLPHYPTLRVRVSEGTMFLSWHALSSPVLPIDTPSSCEKTAGSPVAASLLTSKFRMHSLMPPWPSPVSPRIF
ncbi:hypothetical protein Hypma_011870, partial [Hypsizygus marmoreus]